jgi:hypothetical protein
MTETREIVVSEVEGLGDLAQAFALSLPVIERH